jgi:DHA1 family tetracycline resistance protein-like MFS transporter
VKKDDRSQTGPVKDTGPELNTEKLDFKRILPIFVIVIVDLLGLTVIIPLLPIYAASFDATPFIIGLIGATYPVFQFIGAPLLGRLSDRFGRRPILLISQLGTLIGFLVLGLASTIWMLFLARLIDGISGANISTAQAAISDSTTEKTRTQGLGLIGAAFGIGFVIGPIIAFISLQLGGQNYHVPAFVAAGFSLASLLLTWFWMPETRTKAQRQEEAKESGASFSFSSLFKALAHPTVGLLLVLMFAQQIAFGGFEQLVPLFTLSQLGLSASGNSIIFVFVGVIVVVVQGGLIGIWSRKFGDRKLIYAGLALLSLGLVITSSTPRLPPPWYSKSALQAQMAASGSFSTHESPATQNIAILLPPDEPNGWLGLGVLLVAMLPAAIGGGILQPSINSLITKRVDRSEVGGMLGISSAMLSSANAIAPILGGFIFQSLSPQAPFLFGGLMLAALTLIALFSLKPGREERTPAGLRRAVEER